MLQKICKLKFHAKSFECYSKGHVEDCQGIGGCQSHLGPKSFSNSQCEKQTQYRVKLVGRTHGSCNQVLNTDKSR